MIARNKTKRRAFTLIELLVVIAIIAILTILVTMMYKKYTHSAKCTSFSEQHRKVVNLAEETYNFCRLNGWTYMNRTKKCSNNSRYIRGLKKRNGMTEIRQEGNKCIIKWDCKSGQAGQASAGRSSGWFVDHARAEFNTPSHTGGFIRNDQWQNFEKPGYPSRPGITNIRGYPSEFVQGAQMRIATFLGPDCSDGNYSNSGGHYLIDDITWP